MPLARLRARGELVELRAADLRFTPDEAAAYLNGVMGLELTAQDVAALEERTEGWIAALQLAALSMQGREDVAGFIAGFAGDDRYIVDYLVEEVLQRQPGPVRDFLLQTSILGRLNGSLCDAVTGSRRWQGHARGPRARQPVRGAARRPARVVPLPPPLRRRAPSPARRRVARARPASCTGARATGTPAHGETSEAIEHALAGQVTSRERRSWWSWPMPALRRDRQEIVLRGWLELLPEEVMAVRPVLSNSLRRGAAVHRAGRGGRAAPARRGALARTHRIATRMVVVGRRGAPPAAGRDRRPPCRPGAGAGRPRRPPSPTPERAMGLLDEDDAPRSGQRPRH